MGYMDVRKRNTGEKIVESDKICDKYTSAEKFVDNLLQASNVYCDETTNAFVSQTNLPHFYDEEMFKRGQSFFFKHIFALFMCKFFGLLGLLTIPSVIRILVHTNMSSSNLTAYKRYMSTIFHMVIWYDDDFKPGSRLWQSIEEVRHKHNSASKKCCSAGFGRISQKDMALTQFGFIGIALVKEKKIGIHNATEEEWKAFIHVWRVIGYLFGIEDRFNICRESVQETKEICRLLIDKVFIPGMDRKDPEFLEMTSYLVNGMWCFNPFLKHNVYLNYLYIILRNESQQNIPKNSTYLESNFADYFFLHVLINTVYCLKFNILRVYHNHVQMFALWLMKVCPFLAYYKFGAKKSHINVFSERNKTSNKI